MFGQNSLVGRRTTFGHTHALDAGLSVGAASAMMSSIPTIIHPMNKTTSNDGGLSAKIGSPEQLCMAHSMAAGSNEIRIDDRIENRAFRDERYCLLYHANVGYPVVDSGARIVGNFVQSMPRTPWADHEKATMLEVEPPSDNMEETCYFHETADGVMSVENPALGKRVTVASDLRKFVQWKSRGSGDFVIGLEPCTCWLDDKFGYTILKPGESASHWLVIRISNL